MRKDFRSQSPTGPKHFPTKSDTRTTLFCANRAKSGFSASAVNALIAADFRRNRARADPIDRHIVKLNTKLEDPFQLDASGCFLGCGAPKRDNRLGDKLHRQRCARQVGNVPLAALLELEIVALDIAHQVQSKGR